jgi:hypothetical protein
MSMSRGDHVLLFQFLIPHPLYRGHSSVMRACFSHSSLLTAMMHGGLSFLGACRYPG